jgi:hypothetical protein
LRMKEVPTKMLVADVTSGGFIGLWAVLYVVLMVTLGIMSIRKGHWVMFIIGIFLPLFWLIGALLPRRRMR